MRNRIVASTFTEPWDQDRQILERWWGETEGWAHALGVPPNEISGRFKEKPTGLVNSNSYDLGRYRTRFRKELDSGNLEDIALLRLAPNWRYKALDWDFEAVYGRSSDAFNLFLAAMDVACLASESGFSSFFFVQESVRRSLLYLRPEYGFALIMPHDFLPTGYAIGVAARELPDEMNMDANAWTHYYEGKPGCRECGHSLRNVYGYNILNARHLHIDVGGMRLEDWIKAGGGRRGRIEPLVLDAPESGALAGESSVSELFLWTFQEGEDQEEFLRWDYPPVVAVREELKEFKIFPWQRLAEE